MPPYAGRLIKDTSIIIWSVLLIILGYYWYGQAKPCVNPILYSIGTIDPGFHVSKAEFQKNIENAIALWDDAAGKPLFEYNPKGKLVVNLVYDTRQKTTQEELKLKEHIANKGSEADSIKTQFEILQQRYQISLREYNQMLAQFQMAQDRYNTEVQYWNKRGGASGEKFADLERQKTQLLADQRSLEKKRLEVNELSDETNREVANYNAVIDKINTSVEKINNNGLTGTEFEEGVYIRDKEGTRINIYQFEDKTDFIRVLAHEFGHALDLEHNENPESIMSPVNQSKKIALSIEDKRDLLFLCGALKE